MTSYNTEAVIMQVYIVSEAQTLCAQDIKPTTDTNLIRSCIFLQ